MMKKILIWDFDNTLAYRKGMWGQTAINLLHKRQLTQFSCHDIAPYLQHGFPWHEHSHSHHELMGETPWWDYVTTLIEKALRHLDISDPVLANVLQEYRGAYLDITQWMLFDDTIPALMRLKKQGFEHIILSNHVPELHELVAGLHLTPYVTAIFSSATIGYEKPHPYIFTHMIDTIGRQHAYLMIGDSYQADILGADAVDIPAILVRKENIHRHPFYCRGLSELDPIICDLL